MDTPERCRNCRFFEKKEVEYMPQYGASGGIVPTTYEQIERRCKRFPPPWPSVLEDDWCGEWRHA